MKMCQYASLVTKVQIEIGSTHSVSHVSRATWNGMLSMIRADDGVLGWHLRVARTGSIVLANDVVVPL